MPQTRQWYTSSKGPSAPHYQAQIADEVTGRTIAITYDDEGGHTAALIAAAPSMLSMLEDVGKWLETNLARGTINAGTANRNGDLVSQIRATINQATGRGGG